jgi:hypothetical protein
MRHGLDRGNQGSLHPLQARDEKVYLCTQASITKATTMNTQQNGNHFYWTLGMYGSGSTWLYNVVRQLVFAGRGTLDFRQGYSESFEQIRREPLESQTYVIKSHHPDDAFLDLMKQLAHRTIITIRDPRDAVTSLLTAKHDFLQTVASVRDSARAALFVQNYPRTLTLRYEDGFIDDPDTPRVLGEFLGFSIPTEVYANIFKFNRREKIEEFINRLHEAGQLSNNPNGVNDFYHVDTQWHTHHVGRVGKVGSWRDKLTTAQITEVYDHLGESIRQLGYEQT